MNKMFKLSGILLLILSINIQINAQNDSLFKMSLKDAQEYAIKNSPLTKNAQFDLELAKKKIWETTSIGLPQVSAKYSYSYMLTVPDNIKEFSSLSSLGTWMYGADQTLNALSPGHGFGYIPNPGTPQAVSEKDLKWGSTLDITATQLIFSGAYIVGLQTAKTFKSLSEISITKSENDLKQNVTSAYFLVLIAQENTKFLDTTYNNTKKLHNDMEQMNKQGFIEETDLDQLTITLSNIDNTRKMLARQTEIATNLLKFQIGLDVNSNLELTNNISNFVEESKVQELLIKPFEIANTPEIMLLESQKRLSELNVKYNQSTYLPDIAAFYTHDKNFNKNSFSFTPPDIIGVAVNIPIFSSGMKHSKIQQAKIQLDKTLISKEQASQGLILDYQRSKMDLINALEKYKTSKENLALSEKIQNRTLIKYKEGVSSSIEITQVQNQYLQAQTNYFSAMLEMLNAKAKMEKLLNINK